MDFRVSIPLAVKQAPLPTILPTATTSIAHL